MHRMSGCGRPVRTELSCFESLQLCRPSLQCAGPLSRMPRVLPLSVLQASDRDKVCDPQLYSFLCTQCLIKQTNKQTKKTSQKRFSTLSGIHGGSNQARLPFLGGDRQLEDTELGRWLAGHPWALACLAGRPRPFAHLCTSLKS